MALQKPNSEKNKMLSNEDMKATLNESLEKIRELREYYISELPKDLSPSEREGFRSRINEMFGSARLHVRAIYENGKSLGPNLSGLIKYKENEMYRYHLEGLIRHIEDGPDQIRIAKSLVKETGESKELIEYIAMIAPISKRMG